MDPSLLTTCRGMLMQATQLGERPLAYIMNPATQQHMTDLAAVEAMPNSRPSSEFYSARARSISSCKSSAACRSCRTSSCRMGL